MAYQFPPDVQQLIHEAVAFGNYPTEDDLLRDALHALIQRKEDIAAIQAGVADMNAGRIRPISEVDAEIRNKLGFSSRQYSPCSIHDSSGQSGCLDNSTLGAK
jgi:predicted transcriptional regulator